MSIKGDKSGLALTPPSGSITQGTPVNHAGANQVPRFEGGSISMGTPRQSRTEGSITRGTPVLYEGAGRGSHEGGAGGLPRVYDPMVGMGRGGAVMYDGQLRMMYDPAALEQIYLQQGVSPNSRLYAANMGLHPAAAAQFPGATSYASSHATLMDDFLTARQMRAQDQQRRAAAQDKEQMSPRTREARDPNKPGFPGQGLGPPPPDQAAPIHPAAAAAMGLPYGPVHTPQGLMYLPHPSQLTPTSGAAERSAQGLSASPHPPRMAEARDHPVPTSQPTGWPPHQGRPPQMQSPAISPGSQHHPEHVQYPSRGNVIQATPNRGSSNKALPSPRRGGDPSPHAYRPDSTSTRPPPDAQQSPFATLVDVAANAQSIVIPKDRMGLSPGMREAMGKEAQQRPHMDKEREQQERLAYEAEMERRRREADQQRMMEEHTRRQFADRIERERRQVRPLIIHYALSRNHVSQSFSK